MLTVKLVIGFFFKDSDLSGGSSSVVIFFVAQDRAGAVDLLGEDETNQLMRKGQLR